MIQTNPPPSSTADCMLAFVHTSKQGGGEALVITAVQALLQILETTTAPAKSNSVVDAVNQHHKTSSSRKRARIPTPPQQQQPQQPPPPQQQPQQQPTYYALEIARLLFPWALQHVKASLTVESNNNDGDYDDDDDSNDDDSNDDDDESKNNMDNSATTTTATTQSSTLTTLAWRALQLALSRFLTEQVTPPLTQSVLRQLLPRWLALAVQEMTLSRGSSRDAETMSRHNDNRSPPPCYHAHKLVQVILVHQLYTPVLDAAVDTVLLPLVNALQLQDVYVTRRILPNYQKDDDDDDDEDDKERLAKAQNKTNSANDNNNNNNNNASNIVVQPPTPTATIHDLLQCTLDWLHTRVTQHGNPRTNFTVLVRPDVLLALARIHLLWQAWPDNRLLAEVTYQARRPLPTRKRRHWLYQILHDGLFAPTQHMDGFFSLFKNPTFACYQKELMYNLTAVLSDTDPANAAQVRDMAWFLPVLYRRFGMASQQWYDKVQSEKFRQKAPPLSALQFAMFQRWTTPLLETLQRLATGSHRHNTVLTVGWRALREMTDLLDTFQAYVPAHDTQPGQPQFQYLTRLAQLVLDNYDNDESQRPVPPEASFSGLEQYADRILLVSRLVQLNHLLWRNQWDAVLQCSLQSMDARVHGAVCDLWRVATDTFTQLRQVDEWMVLVANLIVTLDDAVHLDVLSSVWAEPCFHSALASHIQSCPVKQIPAVFTALRTALNAKTTNNLVMASLPWVTIVLRNFQVDPSTADTVSTCLHAFVKDTVHATVCQSPSLPVKKVYTEICGWCIELSMRCVFWLGPAAQLSVPAPIQADIQEGKHVDELLLVMAHRLRQVSSLLHEARLSQIRQESASSLDATALHDEAKLLARRMHTMAHRMSAGQGWIVIAQFIQFWIPFVDKNDVLDLLCWMVEVLSMELAVQEIPYGSVFIADAINLDKQQEVARSLLRDQAFHDYLAVSSQLRLAAVRVAAQWITLAIGNEPKSGGKHSCQGLLGHDEILGLSKTNFVKHWNAIDLPYIFSFKIGKDVMERRLFCASEALKILNGLSPQHAPCRLYSLLYLDRLVNDRFLDKSDARFYTMAALLSSCLRRAILNDMFLTQVPNTTQILEFLLASVEKTSISDIPGPIHETTIYLDLTGKIVEKLVASMASKRKEESSLAFWFDQVLPQSSDSDSDDSEGDDATAYSNADLVLILHTIRGLADVSVTEQIGSCLNSAMSKIPHHFPTTAVPTWRSILMHKILAEVLLIQSRYERVEADEDLREFLIGTCLDWIANGTDYTSYLDVLLTLVTVSKPLSEDVNQKVLQAVSILEGNELVISAIVRRCVGDLSENSISVFMNYLVESANICGCSTRLRLAHMLLTPNVLPECCGQAVESECQQKLLDFSLRCTLPGAAVSKWRTLAPLAVEVWIQAIQNGHSMKRENRVVLLSRIPIMVQTDAKSTELYCACARLMSLLLQRYSKHLSVCAAVVVVALQSFLRQITDVKLSPAELTLRSRHWTRMCELLVPQKEVYKKHLVYVVLESVRAATDGDVRQALMPGWMHLLDTFSPAYELKQLNSLMEDVSTKMRFRPIYEEYRRHHAFRGN